MTGEGQNGLTYSTVTFVTGKDEDGNDIIETYHKLADVGADNTLLKEYNSLLDQLAEKRGVLPSVFRDSLAEMNLTDGMNFVKAMLNASDEELNTYLLAMDEKEKLAEAISQKVTAVQANALESELMNQLNELPTAFVDIGTDSAMQFGETFLNGMATVLENARTLLTAGLGGVFEVDKLGTALSAVKSNMSGMSATLSGVSNTSNVVNNYTQIINSPKTPNRVDIYRNTKNLLGLAGGG